jgi:hypothetical protein
VQDEQLGAVEELIVFEHAEDGVQEFAHGGDEGLEFGFAARLEVLIVGAQVGLVLDGGQRIPSLSSVRTRSTCCLLVSGFLTEITQQIHSLRASGVISSHFSPAAASEMRTFRKSAGTLCAAPAELAFVLTDFILHRYAISAGSPPTLFKLDLIGKLIWTSVVKRIRHTEYSSGVSNFMEGGR